MRLFGIATVSYTHLDVYKIQGICRKRKAHHHISHRASCNSSHSTVAVSYTHLDVYKRQLYRCCEIARKITLKDEWRVGRVIARPYVGKKKGEFVRTSNRHDSVSYTHLVGKFFFDILIDSFSSRMIGPARQKVDYRLSLTTILNHMNRCV